MESGKILFNNITVTSNLVSKIKEAQRDDLQVQKWKEKVGREAIPDFNIQMDGILRYQNRLVVL